MTLWAMADLHLSLGVKKPMDIFGGRWENYMQKIAENWSSQVQQNDTVLLPGDFCWAMTLQEAIPDFDLLESLPGIKILSKGNHDYWWSTIKKLDEFIETRGYRTIRFMHNNSFLVDDIWIAGTRGWECPGENPLSKDDQKVYAREAGRLEASLKSIPAEAEKKVVAMHYPPYHPRLFTSAFTELMETYQVQQCLYGHLHGYGHKSVYEGTRGTTTFHCIASDWLGFRLLNVSACFQGAVDL